MTDIEGWKIYKVRSTFNRYSQKQKFQIHRICNWKFARYVCGIRYIWDMHYTFNSNRVALWSRIKFRISSSIWDIYWMIVSLTGFIATRFYATRCFAVRARYALSTRRSFAANSQGKSCFWCKFANANCARKCQSLAKSITYVTSKIT